MHSSETPGKFFNLTGWNANLADIYEVLSIEDKIYVAAGSNGLLIYDITESTG